ncbi:MAG: Eco57I restriction-modification methylase domain-containing protein, partial [Raineya sp.]|nr:Eco57I restriction-modification methylase domain-containing protein [Raineya sp.]
EANEIVNSLKICDNAVGSGHFLVSALNEIIAIKNDLKILLDRNGKRLKEYHIEVANDELTITDEDGQPFKYKPFSHESQRVQEAIFHEKQTLIEKCLFGVDINPNSVKICRLRLWIELLKNAYYTRESNLKELETLPNIDINIKVGNSLVSRFSLTADLSQALKKSKYGIETYRMAVQTYRNAQNKEQKREMERLIAQIKSDFRTEISKHEPKLVKKRKLEAELFLLTHQISVFATNEKEKQIQLAQIELLTVEIEKLEAEIAQMQNNPLFLRAFEWRFEFPEVLDNEGNFIGFDLIIGNPPYIRHEEIKHLKPFLQSHYQSYHGTADLYVYFIEKAIQLTQDKGFVSLITNNKWLLAAYGEPLRKLLLQKRLLEIINFGDQQVFTEATTYPNILTFQNQNISLYKSEKNDLPLKIRKLVSLFKVVRDVSDLPEGIKQSLVLEEDTENIESFEINLQQLLNYKKELNGLFGILQQALNEIHNLRTQLAERIEFRLALFKEKPQKDISTYINANANMVLQNNLTAEPWIIGKPDEDMLLKKITQNSIPLNQYTQKNVYRGIITGLTEAFLISKEQAEQIIQANPKTQTHLYPVLLGRDIKPYQAGQPTKYLICFEKGFTNKNRNKEAKLWFREQFPEIFQHLQQFEKQAEQRLDKGDYYWELRACDYYDKFKEPKIMYQALQVKSCFIYDEAGLYCNNSIWFIPTQDKTLLGILNSKMGWWLISKYCTHIQNGYQLIWKYFSQIPIATGNEVIRQKITELVDKILSLKRQDQQADTSGLEAEIDRLVYALYGLTETEIKIIERA